MSLQKDSGRKRLQIDEADNSAARPAEKDGRELRRVSYVVSEASNFRLSRM
jgi:hypothetical protein